jgi:hypothetical protein
MALVIDDRVRETTTVTGTNDATLLGAVTGFQAFSVIGNGNTTYYTISDQSGGNWEVGIGTYSSIGPTLERTTVLSSSAGGAKVSFPAGTKDVFVTYPSDKAVYLDASGDVQPALGTVNATTVDTTNLEVTNLKAKDGTAAGSIANSTGVVTLASSVLTTTDINGGTIDGTTIGGSTAAAGNFTTLGATGVATFSAGTVSAPAITTTGDTNTGIFFPAADTIAFTDGGVESMRITSIGQLYVNTTNWPTTTFGNGAGRHIFGGSNAPILLMWNEAAAAANNSSQISLGAKSGVSGTSWAGGSILGATVNNTDNSGYLAFITSNAAGASIQHMRIDSAGNVGIGTSSPSFKLDVTGTGRVTGQLTLGNDALLTNSAYVYSNAGGSGVRAGWFLDGTNQVVSGFTAGTERMRIDSSGNVGIGTSSPSGVGKLAVKTSSTSTSAGLAVIASADDSFLTIYDGSSTLNIGATYSSTGSYRPIAFLTSDVERMRIDSSGNVGIGANITASAISAPSFTVGTGSGSPAITLYSSTTGQSQISFADATSGTGAYDGYMLYDQNSRYMAFGTAATEKMRIDSSGNVGIGTSSPSVRLDVNGIINANGVGGVYLRGGTWDFVKNTSLNILGYGGINSSQWDTLTFFTSGSERMRIDSSGRVGIFTSSPSTNLTVDTGSGAGGSTTWAFELGRGTAVRASIGTAKDTPTDNVSALLLGTNQSEHMRIASSGNIFVGASTTPYDSRFAIFGAKGFTGGLPTNQLQVFDTTAQAANVGGAISFGGLYNSTEYTGWASIAGNKENGTSGEFGGYLRFATRPNGGNDTERMRITSAGNVGIGTSSPQARLHVAIDGSAANLIVSSDISTSSLASRILLGNSVGTARLSLGLNGGGGEVAYLGPEGSFPMYFQTNGTERMRLDTSGTLFIGATSSPSGTQRLVLTADGNAGTEPMLINELRTGSSTENYVRFYRNGSQVGSITNTNTTTAYVTSSDYRLKENVAPMIGALATVSALKPCTYTWKLDGSTGQGFIAHELQKIAPYAVTGEKDGEQMQGVDYGKITPLLTAALQEALAKIESLEARLAALESK